MNYTWSVVISVLFGAGCGVAFAYSNPQFFINKARSSVLLGAVILAIPFTIYFSIEKNPLFTHIFYFLPVFGVVYYFVASLVIEQALETEDAEHNKFMKDSGRTMDKKRREAEIVQQEMSIDDLLAEKARRDAAKEYESHIENISDGELEERIASFRDENRL